jgi:hypothetical protein
MLLPYNLAERARAQPIRQRRILARLLAVGCGQMVGEQVWHPPLISKVRQNCHLAAMRACSSRDA